MKKFADVIRKNPKLQARLKAAKNQDEFINLYIKCAKENGFNFDASELKAKYEEAKKAGTLSESELNQVAGAGNSVAATCEGPFC